MKKMWSNGSVERLKSKNGSTTTKPTACSYKNLWMVNFCGFTTLSLQLITCANDNKVADFATVLYSIEES